MTLKVLKLRPSDRRGMHKVHLPHILHYVRHSQSRRCFPLELPFGLNAQVQRKLAVDAVYLNKLVH